MARRIAALGVGRLGRRDDRGRQAVRKAGDGSLRRGGDNHGAGRGDAFGGRAGETRGLGEVTR